MQVRHIVASDVDTGMRLARVSLIAAVMTYVWQKQMSAARGKRRIVFEESESIDASSSRVTKEEHP